MIAELYIMDFEIKDTGEELTIRLNKSEFDESFLTDLKNRFKIESIVKKAAFDNDIINSLEEERNILWQESKVGYLKTGEKSRN